jgi:malate synthase
MANRWQPWPAVCSKRNGSCCNPEAYGTHKARSRPRVINKSTLDTPEKIFTPELWEAINDVPKGDITIEHIQHAFYMAANYGFQILNGNFAAAIDDYELKLRFMNDLATYRIDVSWLWTLVHHQAAITKDGYLKRPALTEDGVDRLTNATEVKAGTRFTPDLFEEGVGLPQPMDGGVFRRAQTAAAIPAASTAPKRPSSWIF